VVLDGRLDNMAADASTAAVAAAVGHREAGQAADEAASMRWQSALTDRQQLSDLMAPALPRVEQLHITDARRYFDASSLTTVFSPFPPSHPLLLDKCMEYFPHAMRMARWSWTV